MVKTVRLHYASNMNTDVVAGKKLSNVTGSTFSTAFCVLFHPSTKPQCALCERPFTSFTKANNTQGSAGTSLPRKIRDQGISDIHWPSNKLSVSNFSAAASSNQRLNLPSSPQVLLAYFQQVYFCKSLRHINMIYPADMVKAFLVF